jgi:hypothetical protein
VKREAERAKKANKGAKESEGRGAKKPKRGKGGGSDSDSDSDSEAEEEVPSMESADSDSAVVYSGPLLKVEGPLGLWANHYFEISSHYLWQYFDGTKALPMEELPSTQIIITANRQRKKKNWAQKKFIIAKVKRARKKEASRRMPQAAFDLCNLRCRRHELMAENGIFYLDIVADPEDSSTHGQSDMQSVMLQADPTCEDVGDEAQRWIDEIEEVQVDYGAAANTNVELMHYCKQPDDSSSNRKNIERTLERLADVNHKDPLGNTPLIEVTRHNKVKAAALLLERSAKPTIKNNLGSSALHEAVSARSGECTQRRGASEPCTCKQASQPASKRAA